MKFSIAVFGAPYSSQAALSALHFAAAVIDADHELYRVFFYHDGVYTGNSLISAPQDEVDLHKEWQTLASTHSIELVVCIASALRRGMLDEDEAVRYEKPGHSLGDEFTVAGLGQLIDAALESDRLITFSA